MATYSSICSTLPYLPPFTQQVLAQINANFDSNFTGLQDSKGYPTEAGMETLVPLLGTQTAALQIDCYIATKYLLDKCRNALGLSVAPTLTSR